MFLLFVTISYSQPPPQHVILVIIDGARYSETLGDAGGQYIPRMKQLASQGSIVQTFLNDSITITKQAIPAIWCGSWSKPRDTVINGFSTQYATVPTVWEYLRKDHALDSTDAMYILKYLNGPWLPSYHPQYGPLYWPKYVLQGSNDLQVWQNARALFETLHPRFAILYLADVDGAGHSGNWTTYTRAITVADSIVGMLWDFLKTNPHYKNTTTLIVTNDHGRHLDGVGSGFVGHGDGCWGCRRIMLLSIGSAVKQGFSSSIQRKIPDITPTVGAILNFSSPFVSGTVISELLTPIYYNEPDSIHFGDVLRSTSKVDSFKIYNSGGVSLIISNITASDTVITINPIAATVTPHSNKTFRITFSPDKIGVLNAKLFISHDASARSDTIMLTGTGIRPPGEICVDIEKGWNLLSLPVRSSDSNITSLYPNTITRAFIYRDGYIAVDTIGMRKGYWLKFNTQQQVTITGSPIYSDTVHLLGGWNLIGSMSKPVLVSSITSDPPGIIASNFFSYSGSYTIADTLVPGKGYWLKVGQEGKLILLASD